MNDTVKNAIDACSTIAEKINSDTLKNIIKYDIRFLDGNDKPNITLIGQPFNELFDILYGLLEIPPLLSKAIYRANKSYHVKVFYGEELSFRLSNLNGELVPVTKAKFENEFVNDNQIFDTNIINAEISIKSTILDNININLICSKNNFEDFNWIRNFTTTDYVVFLLSATSLLSFSEKNFLNGEAANELGYERLAVLVNNIDRVDNSGRLEIEESVKRFFAQHKNLPIFYYSARSVLLSQANNQNIETEYINFINYIKYEFIDKASEFRNLAITQSVNLCIRETEKSMVEAKKNLNINKDKIQKAIDKLEAESGSMDEKKASIKRKINLFINGSVKLDFLKKIDDFNEKLKVDIREGIIKCDDLEKLKKSISPYIENVWSEFFKQQEPWLKNSIYAEVNQLSKSIQDDVAGLIASMDSEMGELVLRDILNRYNFDTISATKIKSDNLAATLSKYLSVGGLALFLVNVPLAVVTVGSSQIIKLVFKENIENDKKEKLAILAMENCDKLKKENIKSVEDAFSSIIDKLSDEAEKSYDRLISIIITSLKDQKTIIENSKYMFTYLEEAENSIIPELKEKQEKR